MFILQKLNVKQFWLLLSGLALMLLFAACTGSSTGSASTPTATPKPTPSPTPSGTLYKGNGYTLKYPQGWKVVSQNGVTGEIIGFTPSSGGENTAFTITVTNPVSDLNLDSALAGGTTGLKGQLTNYKTDTTLASSVTIGGDSWKQGGGTGDNHGTPTKGVVIVDQHPASTGKLFIIALVDSVSSYNQTNTSAFQPMLQSFQFS